MNRRTDALLRDYVELVAWLETPVFGLSLHGALLRDYVELVARSAEAGHMTTYAAACRMAAAGVPIEAALRTLTRRTA